MEYRPSEESRSLAWSPWMTLGWYATLFAMDFLCQSFVLVAATVFIVAHSASPLEPQSVVAALSHNGQFFVLLSFVSAILTSTGLTVIIRRRTASVAEYLAIRAIEPVPAAGWLLLGVAFAVVQSYLYSWLQIPSTNFWESIVQSIALKPLLFLSMVLISPAIEEMLYRGFLFRGILHSRLGGVGAILISSLTWAGAHFQYNLYERAAIFGLGCLLGFVRLRKNSLTHSFLIHAGVNLTGWILLMLS